MRTEQRRLYNDAGRTSALFTSVPSEQAFTAPAHQGRVAAFADLYDPEYRGIHGGESGALSLWGQNLQIRLQFIQQDLSQHVEVYSGHDHLDQAQKRFRDRVLDSISAEPVEDGYSHPAENLLGRALESDTDAAANWIRLSVLDRSHPAIAAAVLRCLSRISSPVTEDWRADLVAEALTSPDVEVRDAAAQAVELWEDERSIGVLRRHNESVPWLRAYIEQVLDTAVE